jgi:hypothetical protein
MSNNPTLIVGSQDRANRLFVRENLAAKVEEFYNKCHNPGGAEGGKFCETTDPAEANKRDIVVSGQRLGTAVPTAKTAKGLEGAGPKDESGHRRMGVGLIPDGAVGKIIARQALVPGFEDLAGRTDRAALDEIIERQSRNIEDVYDIAHQIGDDTAAAHASWYPWVNKYTQSLANDTGLDHNGIMAAAAVLSPSADWANNVSWAKATAEFVANEKNIIVQPEWISSGYKAALASWKTAKESAAKEGRELSTPMPTKESVQGLVGKTVSDLSPDQAAIVLRGAHEAFGKAIHQMGDYPGLGKSSSIATPQSNSNFAKAISVLRNPSPENISEQLGNNHKVRSFYENMRDPLDNTNQEVTVDSHHIGLANGIPITGGNPMVPAGKAGNVKDKPLIKLIYDGPKVAATGLVGTYPLVVEATRRATERINQKYGTDYRPNQIQSITWETWRGINPSRSRTKTRTDRIIAARQAFAKSKGSARDRALMLSSIEDARLDAKLGPKGPVLADLRKKFLKEIEKGAR